MAEKDAALESLRAWARGAKSVIEEAIELSDMTHEARQRLLAFLSRAPEEAK